MPPRASNSYVVRLRRYRHNLAIHRKNYLRRNPSALMNNRVLNSYVERLRSFRRRRLTQRRSAKRILELNILLRRHIQRCPVCKSSEGKPTFRVAAHRNRFTGRVYGFYMSVAHNMKQSDGSYKTVQCYVRRNLYEEAFNDPLPLDAPVLEHFYFQRSVDPSVSWRY